jgi:predicted MFS family arabinose efflux permease
VREVTTVGERATYRKVFAAREFRAIFLAQVTSVTGDQLARVALMVLVYERTRSALLAALTFAVSILPVFLGGVLLAGIGDRLPRRQVMVSCDITRAGLVALMAIPEMPVAALVVLLFIVTFLEAPFRSARTAAYPDILPGDLFPLGQAISATTYQAAQVAGFAAGGIVTGVIGARPTLVADAATFAASAILIRVRVRPHRPGAADDDVRGTGSPQSSAAKPSRPRPLADAKEGARLVFRTPALRTPILLAWLAVFYDTPEGIAAPLAHSLGGGATATGVILAARALGATVGGIAFSRLVPSSRQVALLAPFAACCCATLGLFVFRPDLVLSVLILVSTGLLTGYVPAASSAFVAAAPASRRAQVFGLAQGGMNLGQGVAMMLAGLAANYFSTPTVIAVSGALGVLAAMVITTASPTPAAITDQSHA